VSVVRMVRRLAADILGVGESRVWIDPEKLDRVETAVTREDVRRLIHDGVIRKLPPSTPSRGRWRIRRLQRKKGRRRRGPGRRRGPWISEKELWIMRIRAQRRYLRMLRDKGIIDARTYRRLYMLAKGGMFRSVAHIRMYLREHGLLKVSGGGEER